MTAVTTPKPTKRPAKEQPSVLFDAPGPRARMRYRIYTAISALVLLAILGVIVQRMAKEHQFDSALWHPFITGTVWTSYLLPGLRVTLTCFAYGSVLALVFGMVFGLGRLSDHAWIRVPAGAVVEFFRAIPLLLLIFFIFSGPATIMDALGYVPIDISATAAVAIGLMLYNGSVLAEVFRAGIRAVPRGQSEAAYAIGLRKSGVMWRILLPQATTAMMPAIVSQLVILLKDSALGFIIGNQDLLAEGAHIIPLQYHSDYTDNKIPAAIVIAAIYISINLTISYVANMLERRSRRSRKSSARTLSADITVQPTPGVGIGAGT